jgi:hypothetical protein
MLDGDREPRRLRCVGHAAASVDGHDGGRGAHHLTLTRRWVGLFSAPGH